MSSRLFTYRKKHVMHCNMVTENKHKACWLAIIVLLVVAGNSGCKKANPVRPLWNPKISPHVRVWCDMIAQAGLPDYAAEGKELLRQRDIYLVSPPRLDARYNAFTWFPEAVIWINTPMFDRYPRIADQAEIFLHELIHVRSQEMSHSGPWWSALTTYRSYWDGK